MVGEWWNVDVEEVVKKGNNMGLPPNTSDAHTINGKPGPLFPCSEKRKQRSLKFNIKKKKLLAHYRLIRKIIS